jgi:hypothetical protein
MAASLSSQCTPLKRAYDQCFNSWFEGYLQPAIDESSASRKPGIGVNDEARRQYSKRKAEEFEVKCGKVWESYRACIAVSFYSFLSSSGPFHRPTLSSFSIQPVQSAVLTEPFYPPASA